MSAAGRFSAGLYAVIAAVLFLQLGAACTPAAALSAQDMMTEMVRNMEGGPQTANVAMWFPFEVIEALAVDGAAASGQPMTAVQKQDLKNVLGPYFIVAVVCGKIEDNGALSWTDASVIRSNIVAINSAGVQCKPAENVPMEVSGIVGMLRGMMQSMLGQMGENLQFVLFPAKTADGTAFADPLKKGTFTVSLNGVNGVNDPAVWTLPIESLLPPRTCPKCTGKVKYIWNFCPACGESVKWDG